MNTQILKLILAVSIFLQAGCDITFKRKVDADNNIQVKQDKNIKPISEKVERNNVFNKNDAYIISNYYSDKANSIIRQDMIMHTKISIQQKNKMKVGKIIPANVQVIPLPLNLERILSPLPLHNIRVQVGVQVILMNVKSRKILDSIKI